METLRLQKYLAQAGLASRREAERLIAAGRVCINGQIVTEMGLQIHPETDQISLDGKPIRQKPTLQYVLFYKPEGYLVTRTDTHNRSTIYDLLPASFHSLHPVGRLDNNSSGLLLLTNDGEITQRLLHPRYHVTKIYRVEVSGRVLKSQVRQLCAGIELDDGATQPTEIHILDSNEQLAILEFHLREGKKRQIRRMCQAMGWQVMRLQRLDFGGIGLGQLQAGEYRHLEATEIATLRMSAGLK